MTVKELIEQLAKLPQDMQVVAGAGCYVPELEIVKKAEVQDHVCGPSFEEGTYVVIVTDI